jgi:hypothetical protein
MAVTLTEEQAMPKISGDSTGGYPPVLSLDDDSDPVSIDKFWHSEEVKARISVSLKSMIKGNTECFSRIDIRPLYRDGTHGYYRAIIYIRDYRGDGYLTLNRVYRDYFIEVEGKDCRICSINPPLVGKI